MEPFKRINDSHGHDGGDDVLREFAKRVSATLRASDTAARIGGEEFAVAMPDTDEQAAKAVCERIRVGVETRPFGAGIVSLPVTVSIGYALLRDDDDLSKLMKRADLALYLAKEKGRNQVASLSA